jgi:hypothetical protein
MSFPKHYAWVGSAVAFVDGALWFVVIPVGGGSGLLFSVTEMVVAGPPARVERV